MQRSALVCSLMVLGASFVATPASSHHSNVAFEVTKVISLKGAVREFKWVNPHTWIYLTVEQPGGAIEEWEIEGRPPGILSRAGWSKNVITPGEKITVYFSPAKDGTRSGLVARVVKEDGTILANGPPATE